MKTIKSISISIFFLMAMSMELSMTKAQDTSRIGFNELTHEMSLDYSKHYFADDGFRWIPGHWTFKGVYSHYVRGIWVRPNNYEYLWAPNVFVLHPGKFWPYITLYTGVNYGYGFGDKSYSNDKWEDGIIFSF